MLPHILIETAVRDALKEDLGHGHDITSNLVIPADAESRATFVARDAGVLAGLMLALTAFSLTDPDFDMVVHATDGDAIESGQAIIEINGSARGILSAERVALNFMSHMSGIATMTNLFVHEVKGTGTQICDTRKTLPGLRAFQKYAVRMGGGVNHRFGLDDAILIKDNHIAIAGGIIPALENASLLRGHTVKTEIEVDTLVQLEEVLSHGGADIVMLDNMDIETLQKAVEMAKGQITTEASGGVTLETVRSIAETGVDYISVGALTHSVTALDIGLDIDNG